MKGGANLPPRIPQMIIKCDILVCIFNSWHEEMPGADRLVKYKTSRLSASHTYTIVTHTVLDGYTT